MLSTQKRQASRRHVAAVSAAILAAGVSLTMFAPSALADVDDHFELEGNVLDDAANPDPDWGAGASTSIFVLPGGYNTTTASPPPLARSPLPTTFFDAGFAVDFIPGKTSDTSSFAGSSKDQNDIDTWKCKTEANMTDKGDIQNAYAAVATDPVTGNLLLYFGMEKNAPNGNNNMGVWFLQDGTVGCDGTGVAGSGLQFTGLHTDGDIFLVAAFTNGGANPQITAYQWDNGGLILKDSGGACGALGSEDLCAITNDTASVQTPWQTTNKNSANPQNKTGQGTTLDADQFYEGAVDLTANELDVDSEGNPVCVNRFLFNTRSSQELTATLYDYAAGDVETCAEPTISTLLFEDTNLPAGPQGAGDPADNDLPSSAGNHTVTAPAKVYDTSTLGGTFFPDADGTVTYTVYNNATCDDDPASNVVYTETVGINADGTTIPASTVQTFNTPGTYYWVAAYTPSSTSRNEAAASACDAEPLIIRAIPTLETTILLQDKVKVSGVTSDDVPQGSVVFTLWASDNCTGTKWYDSGSKTLVNGLATSDAVAVAAGTYSWKVVFTPDSTELDYAGAQTKCSPTADETAVIAYQAPSPIEPTPSPVP